MFFLVSVLQIAGDSEVGVKLLEKSLIKNVQVSLCTVLCAGYVPSIQFFFSLCPKLFTAPGFRHSV